MAHQPRDTTGGLENSVRQSWCNGSKIKILSSITNKWVTAHIVTIHKDWLYCLLEDGDTKKIDRWDASVQPMNTTDDGEDDEELFWLKDDFNSTPGGIPTDIAPGQSMMSLGFNTLAKTAMTDDFSSTKIAHNNETSQQSKQQRVATQAAEREYASSKMCGYTIWVQWCDSSSLHGYYHCVGLRNNRYHFKKRRDSAAELFADDKGFWYLMYDMKCLYKSKKKTAEDPPPRNWKCIEGSLPPPGVSQVALPDDAMPMVIIEEKHNNNDDDDDDDEDILTLDDDDTASQISRSTTIQHNEIKTPKHHKKSKQNKNKSKKGKNKNKKKEKEGKKKLIAKLFQDEFEVDIDVFDFHFDGNKQVAFHLNIGRHMEVTKVKKGGQAQELGVIQGDILFKINESDISKDWEKATNLLRSYVASKQQFTITFVRRKVESLMITIVRAGNQEFNGKYRFYKRDADDEMCPIYVKNEDLEEMKLFTDESDNNEIDAINSNSANIHIIQRVYRNPESSEALWVIKNGCDDHYYMCVTDEYLPPQHGWELVPESEANYPAPGLQFTSSRNKYDHVNRLRGYTNADDDDNKTNAINTADVHHDALNINNRNRTNKHQHEKTLTRMRQTLGSTDEFNKSTANKNRSHTGGVSGYLPNKPGIGYAQNKMAAGKRGGFGSKLFGKNKKQTKKQSIIATKQHKISSGNQSASETEEDSAKLEKIWKSKLEETTKNAINQLTTQHKEELKSKDSEVKDLYESVENLRVSVNDSGENYYQLYLEKCELSLILQEKQIELKRSKDKYKEIGKRLFYQQQKTDELQSKLTLLSSSFSSRMNTIQSMPKKHRPTKSTVNDLASIEAQFRNLLQKDTTKTKTIATTTKTSDSSYLENEIIGLKERLSHNNDELLLIKQENERLKGEKESLARKMNEKSKQEGVNHFYQERSAKLSAKLSVFQQNIYNLMSLLQNIEQEYMQKCGKLPKATKTIDWRNEYDPKRYKEKVKKQEINHQQNATFVIINNDAKKSKKKHKKDKKQKQKQNARSATQAVAINMKQIPKHHGRAANESRIIDL